MEFRTNLQRLFPADAANTSIMAEGPRHTHFEFLSVGSEWKMALFGNSYRTYFSRKSYVQLAKGEKRDPASVHNGNDLNMERF